MRGYTRPGDGRSCGPFLKHTFVILLLCVCARTRSCMGVSVCACACAPGVGERELEEPRRVEALGTACYKRRRVNTPDKA